MSKKVFARNSMPSSEYIPFRPILSHYISILPSSLLQLLSSSSHPSNFLHPLPPQPAIKELQACFRLIIRHHVPCAMKAHECEVAAALDLTNLASVAVEAQIRQLDFVKSFLAGPLERFGPSLVAEPVADEVGVTLKRRSQSGVPRCIEKVRGTGVVDLQRR